jgi:phage-related protein
MPTIKVYGNGDLHLTHNPTGTNIDVYGVDTFCIIDVPSGRVFDKNNNVILNRVSGTIDTIINPGGGAGGITVSSWVTRVDVKFNRRWL